VTDDTCPQALQDIKSLDNIDKLTSALPSKGSGPQTCKAVTGKHTSDKISVVSSDEENEKSQTQYLTAMRWEMLDSSLQTVLPKEEGLMYVVTEFNALSTSTFSGAPNHSFEATVRINVKTIGSC